MRALVFGEILWDIIEGTPHLGGAPFNLAAHLARMGWQVTMLSAVGEDELGNRALERAIEYGIDTGYVATLADRPTGTVDVVVDDAGLPDYVIHENVAWDAIGLQPDAFDSIVSTGWDAICVGTLAQRSEANRLLLRRLLTEARRAQVFYDVNLRQAYFDRDRIERTLLEATIVKVNDDEAEELGRMFFSATLPIEAFSRRLSEAYGLEVVIVTRGADGAFVRSRHATRYTGCGEVVVSDTVGAGDSFSAAFLNAYLADRRPDAIADAADLAAEVADFVVTRPGAIPDYPEALSARLRGVGR